MNKPTIDHKQILQYSMPGYIAIKDVQSKYIFANANLATLTGFSHPEEIIGLSDSDLNCEAANSAELYIAQDKKTMIEKKERALLTIETYKDNKPQIALGISKPYFSEDNDVTGVIITAYMLDLNVLVDLNAKLNYLLSFKENIIYEISQPYKDFNLSKLESTCLFYMIRGLSNREIGNIMHRSARTIENYIDNLKDKLKCNSRRAIVNKCFSLGYQFIIPSWLI